MHKYKIRIILTLILIDINLSGIEAKELETFIQDNNFYNKGNLSLVLENSYHFHDIEDDEKDLEYEYENNVSSLGVGYSIDEKSVVRGSFSYAYNVSNSSEASFINDPIFSYWRRVSSADSESDTYGDLGIEIIPFISSKYSKQTWFGNSLSLKYRFGLGDAKQNIHATYFIGIQEGRSFREDGEKRGVSSNLFYGIDLVYEYFFTPKFSLGGRVNLEKNSEHSGTAYFVNSEFASSWSTGYNVFTSYDLSNSYNLTMNYMSLNEGPSANKFKTSRDLDVEEKRLLLSINLKNFEL